MRSSSLVMVKSKMRRRGTFVFEDSNRHSCKRLYDRESEFFKFLLLEKILKNKKNVFGIIKSDHLKNKKKN